MRLQNTPPNGAGKSQGVTKTERLVQIVEGLGQDKATFLPLGIRTSDLAERAGVPRGSVQALLAPYVDSGRLQCCKVSVPGSPPQNEYRKGAGKGRQMNRETLIAQGPVECRVMHSFTDDAGKRWTACAECDRGGNGNAEDKCSCGWQCTKWNSLGCFLGTAIVGEPKAQPKRTRSQERYRRFLEYGDGFDSFLQFCRWDSAPDRSWNCGA